jgi:hypothetical protein
MSALPPKADMDQRGWDVRFVPKADIMQRSKKARVEVLQDTFYFSTRYKRHRLGTPLSR